ncbi:STAS domain-containing protein [Oceanobacillus halophilus]|uniref:Anti-sigma factor antagonist n=1 Tax=Oceanobacillus halophilus TaxID=930130 RepID=A0A494ZWC7_9BACI|nr:STAS domain-containing protein [Oceanobacillus halophilus]RKQ30934.1 anti-sigma factor antagonist [Oceanobacillus halophilus]
MELSIHLTEKNNSLVIHLSGEIDAYTAPQLKERLLPLTKQNGTLIKVDMEAVQYMDSTGLGVFISALKSTKENNSKMKLIHIDERVYRVFKITGLDEIMDLEPRNKVERRNG